MATEEVGVVELRVRDNKVCLSHPRRSKAMCRGCLRPPRNVQRLPPRAAPAGNRGMVFTHEVVSTAVYTIYRIRSPKDGGAHIHRYHMHCHRNSVLSYTFSPDETTTSRQCDKHLEMVATKIADHVELPISQLNISRSHCAGVSP